MEWKLFCGKHTQPPKYNFFMPAKKWVQNQMAYCETIFLVSQHLARRNSKRAHSFIILFICEIPQLRVYIETMNTSICCPHTCVFLGSTTFHDKPTPIGISTPSWAATLSVTKGNLSWRDFFLGGGLLLQYIIGLFVWSLTHWPCDRFSHSTCNSACHAKI